MSRDYRIIKGGKFHGESFNVNAAGSLLLGHIMESLGLPVASHPEVSAPHEITSEDAKAIARAIKDPNFAKKVRDAVAAVPYRHELSLATIEEDAQWAMEFLNMALGEEGFASDYCEKYH